MSRIQTIAGFLNAPLKNILGDKISQVEKKQTKCGKLKKKKKRKKSLVLEALESTSDRCESSGASAWRR